MTMMNEDPAAGAGAGGDPADAGEGAGGGEGTGTLLNGSEGGGEGGEGGDELAWLPEKFRVNGEDGKLDEGASARKLAESYRELESHKGPIAKPPASADDYAIAIEGLDDEGLAAFKADERFKDFAKAAHEAGMTDAQMNLVVNRYLEVAPGMAEGAAALSAEEARAELAKVWTDEASMKQNLSSVVRAIKTFGAEAEDVPGSAARLMEKYGTDPDFIAFAATVAKELPEDTSAGGQGVSSDMDVEALQKSEAYWTPTHPDHEKVKAQVAQHYARKYGTKSRGGVTKAGG